MQNNHIVIITGAGFSAPARLPIQNRILKEMLKPHSTSILDVEDEKQSLKFLHAFIEVGLFLLSTYCDSNNELLNKEYEQIISNTKKAKAIGDFIIQWSNDTNIDDNKKQEVLAEMSSYVPRINEYYTSLETFKEKIRSRLAEAQIDISLEDIFTSFDKAMISKEHSRRYTYYNMDSIRHSIMRLFTYYFGKITQAHQYNMQDYLQAIKYVQQNRKNITIISTNWDTIWEGYFLSQSIPYDLSLNDKYFIYDDAKKNKSYNKGAIKLIKVHGSINWFRCLNCGTLSIIEKKPYGKYLFDDSSEEKCIACNQVSKGRSVLIQPEIITPSMIKSIDNQLYKNLWKAASAELMKATKVIFIGYSFPIADYELRYLLQKNISSNSEMDIILHSTDDPKAVAKQDGYLKQLLPKKRYMDVFNQNNPKFFYNGLGSYFKNELEKI